MMQGIYSIRDVKTGYMNPVIEPNNSVATRNFANAVMQGTGVLYSHAGDFDLYKLADFDSDSGVITPVVPPEFVVSAASLKEV